MSSSVTAQYTKGEGAGAAAKAGLHCARVKVPLARVSNSTCMQPPGREGWATGAEAEAAEAGEWQWRDNGRRQGDCSVTDVAQGGERACTRKALTRCADASPQPWRRSSSSPRRGRRMCASVREDRYRCARGEAAAHTAERSSQGAAARACVSWSAGDVSRAPAGCCRRAVCVPDRRSISAGGAPKVAWGGRGF